MELEVSDLVCCNDVVTTLQKSMHQNSSYQKKNSSQLTNIEKKYQNGIRIMIIQYKISLVQISDQRYQKPLKFNKKYIWNQSNRE